jgi:hypothetical protein
MLRLVKQGDFYVYYPTAIFAMVAAAAIVEPAAAPKKALLAFVLNLINPPSTPLAAVTLSLTTRSHVDLASISQGSAIIITEIRKSKY